MGKGCKITPLALICLGLLVACGAEAWEQDPDVQAAKAACQGLDAVDEFACIERHAVDSLNPDVCRLLGIAVDDMCLQSVYQAANDPAICDQLYLKGVRPTCRAYYAARAVPTAASSPFLSPTPSSAVTVTTSPLPTPSPTTAPLPATLGWQRILFVYNQEGAAELWTIDPANGAVQRQIRPEQTIQDPALSPSGEALTYVRVTGDYSGVVSELWLMDRDGAHPRLLYVPPADQSVLSRPAWSPDGEEIYFLQGGAGTGSPLLRLPVSGGEPTTVLTDCLDYALAPHAKWKWLVGLSPERTLAIFGREGSPVRDLEPQAIEFLDTYSLAISPDGRLLAFRAVEAGGKDTWNLYVMTWEGAVSRLTDLSGFHPLTTSTGQVNGLAWTADGTHLVYSVDGHQQQRGIWRTGLDGGEPERLFTWEEDEWAAVQGPWFEPGLSARLADENAQALLADYSQALSSGEIAREEFYAPFMRDLIAERRAYYQEFFEIALHSTLLGIHSRYELPMVAPDAVTDGLFHIRATEWLTLTGRYREPTAGEYTPTRAVLWALARTDHPAVREALQKTLDVQMKEYLARLQIEDRYDLVWIVRHHLLAKESPQGLVLVQDTFDDKANDNPDGTDVVDWIDGKFVRRKPDLTLWPDYVIYHEPLDKVEAEGKRLLKSYAERYGGTPAPDPHPGWLTYTHPIYGFSFRYPPDWETIEKTGMPHIVRLRPRQTDAVELVIGARWPDEEAGIQRTGVGAGKVETQGSVRFLGRELARAVLVYEGKVKAILYYNACQIDVDGLIFTLSLDDRSLDYETGAIAPEVQALADEIVSSFLLP